MPDLFGVDIAQEIADAFAGQLVTGTLVKVTPGTRTPGSLTGGTNPTPANYAFEGFLDNGSEKRVAGLAPLDGEFMSILGNSLTSGIVPAVNDRATLDGKTYTLVELVERDPAAALYKFRVEV